MSEFEAAEAAVQAALDAGATYADVRVMHRRAESMQARDGDVEDVSQSSDSGLGVRALVGSGWGFFAVPDVEFDAARRAGHRAAEIAEASGLVARPGAGMIPAEAVVGSWASEWKANPIPRNCQTQPTASGRPSSVQTKVAPSGTSRVGLGQRSTGSASSLRGLPPTEREKLSATRTSLPRDSSSGGGVPSGAEARQAAPRTTRAAERP